MEPNSFNKNLIKKLKEKGIKNNTIDQYINVNSCAWFDNAAQLYNKKYGQEPISDYSDWSKRARFIQSRGFNMEHIHSVVPPVETD